MMRVYGVVAAVEAGVVRVDCAHHEAGLTEPLRVAVRVRGSLADWCGHELDPGDQVLAVGYGFQRRSPDGPELWCDADLVVARPEAGYEFFAPVFVSAHGVISEGPRLAVAEAGGHIGDEVCDLAIHVRSPHRDGPTRLKATAWKGAAHWIAKTHVEGDRINVEGVLREQRWRDAGGVPRRSHEVTVRRWHYAKPPGGQP